MKSRIACFSIIMLSVMFFSQSCFGQEKENVFDNSLQKGSKAILFEINSDLYIESYIGAIISAKKHISDQTAIRFGLSAHVSLSTQTDKRVYDTGAEETDRKYISNSEDISLCVEYLNYLITTKRLNFFLSGGPTISYGHSCDKHYEDYYYNDEEDYKNVENDIGFGISGSIGIEYFLVHDISFIAEYSLAAIYEYSKRTNESKYSDWLYKNESISHSFGLNSKSKKIGLTFYF